MQSFSPTRSSHPATESVSHPATSAEHGAKKDTAAEERESECGRENVSKIHRLNTVVLCHAIICVHIAREVQTLAVLAGTSSQEADSLSHEHKLQWTPHPLKCAGWSWLVLCIQEDTQINQIALHGCRSAHTQLVSSSKPQSTDKVKFLLPRIRTRLLINSGAGTLYPVAISQHCTSGRRARAAS